MLASSASFILCDTMARSALASQNYGNKCESKFECGKSMHAWGIVYLFAISNTLVFFICIGTHYRCCLLV